MNYKRRFKKSLKEIEIPSIENVLGTSAVEKEKNKRF